MSDKCDECPAHAEIVFVLANVSKQVDQVTGISNAVATLTTKVTMLLVILSAITTILISGCVYTFTALSKFDSTFSAYRLVDQKYLIDMQKKQHLVVMAQVTALDKRIQYELKRVTLEVDNLEAACRSHKTKIQ